jgi:hypothetical protein
VSCSWPIALTTGVRQAGDHDHVHLGVAIEAVQRVDHLLHRVGALYRGLLDPEPDGGPAPARVLHDVPLSRRIASADQADNAGQEGKHPLSFGRKKPFGSELAAEPFQPREQLADADRPDLQRRQGERAPVGVEVRPGPDDHPGAFRRSRLGRVEHLPGADDPHRHGRDRVAQGQEHGAAAHRALGDLPLDPDPAQPPDPPADQLEDRADRDGGLGGGVERH